MICSVYFFKDRGCDEMTAIRLEAQKTYDMQAYIDKMYGGPGKAGSGSSPTPRRPVR